MTSPDPDLTDWIDSQLRRSAILMLRAVSAVDVVKRRPALGQHIVPKRGSVVAALTLAEDASPDYFFHWLRDSSLVMDAVGVLGRECVIAPAVAADIFRDYIGFSLDLTRLDGAQEMRRGQWGRTDDPLIAPYLRSPLELETATGSDLLGEVRFNPDGTLDVLEWARPQFDGPAMRALTLLRHRAFGLEAGGETTAMARDLLDIDIDFTSEHGGEPCYDLWEERYGRHFHTIAVQRAALSAAARWAEAQGNTNGRARLRARAGDLDPILERFWQPQTGRIVSSLDGEPRPDRDLDGAVLLGFLHGRDPVGPTSILDPRAQATFQQLEGLFGEMLPVNALLGEQRGPLFGRFRDDGYFGGGAYLMTTLAAAELLYRVAAALRTGSTVECTSDNAEFLGRMGFAVDDSGPVPASADAMPDAVARFVARGDAILAALQSLTPETGALPEQFDRETGEPASADDLAWSHGAFITTWSARRRATL